MAANESFVAVVPFWAVWPFEVMVLPVRHVDDLESMTTAERDGLAAILHTVTQTYDKVFDTPFPYSMGLHPRPYDGEEHPGVAFSRAFLPASVTVGDHPGNSMVGFELLGGRSRILRLSRLRRHCGRHWRGRFRGYLLPPPVVLSPFVSAIYGGSNPVKYS